MPCLLQTADAKTTQIGDHELFATPTIETSDPEYKWVESAVWVAEGRFVVGEDGDGVVAIEYEVHRVKRSNMQR